MSPNFNLNQKVWSFEIWKKSSIFLISVQLKIHIEDGWFLLVDLKESLWLFSLMHFSNHIIKQAYIIFWNIVIHKWCAYKWFYVYKHILQSLIAFKLFKMTLQFFVYICPPERKIHFVLISEKIELCATSYSTNLAWCVSTVLDEF